MIIADIDFWLALSDEKDSYHQAANQAFQTYDDPLITTWLDLNQQHHEEEEVRGQKAAGTLNKGKAKGTRTKKTSPKPQANAPTIPGLAL
jgi:hypothetical protein